MPIIEHRRHSMRIIPGDHLSQPGVDRARGVGATLGRFDLVVTSSVTRAFETAIAMGYAVNELLPGLAPPPIAVQAEAGWEKGCAEYARVAVNGGPTARYLADLAELFHALASRLPEDGRALVISPGGVIEASVVACTPTTDYSGWDTSAGYCEGVRFRVRDRKFVDVEILTVPNV